MSKVVTRFAPSPTGFLHIGNTRTALFNWLFARHCGGDFLLRIEDTDRERSTPEAIDVILDGMKWLGLDWDGDAVLQFPRRHRHAEIAQQLVAQGQAYYCYATPQELEDMRAEQIEKGLPQKYDGRWRDRDPAEAPADVKPVVRIKAPKDQNGDIVIHDLIQGEVKVPMSQLDDMVLLRSDGTPTYMLSVVVDDHDMGVTHIIRGDDHLTNAFRQRLIYDAMGWTAPHFAHLPLIHGSDGAKLSKRHGAISLTAYRDMGYLPEAMCNYLLRLGWGHGDIDIIDRDEVVKIFELADVGKSASRMDYAKLDRVNAHYMRQMDDDTLLPLLLPFVADALGHAPDDAGVARLKRGLTDLKERASTLVELAHAGLFYLRPRPLALDADAGKLMDPDTRTMLGDLKTALESVPEFTGTAVEQALKDFAKTKDLKMGKVAMPLRAAITGTTNSPSIFNVAEILGKEETLARISDVVP